MKKLLLGLLALSSLHAAEVPISGLPAISAVTSSTVVPVVDVSGTPTTKKATVGQFVGGLPGASGSVAGLMSAADKTKLDAAASSNTASAIAQRDGSGNFAANVITAASVTGLSSPVNATDAANKAYVDAAAAGLVIKTPAVAATISTNVTLAGGAPNTLDGVTLHANDRVLVKNQTDDKQNGIYFVQTLGSGANGTWARTTDADTGAKLVTGSYVFVTGGTTNVNSAWTMVTTGTITIGTSSIVWNLFSQVTQILASNIIGQIVGSQVQDAAINTAKFASGITPVEITGTLPVSGNFAGRTVFLTTDSKLYRYNGSSFVSTLPTGDLTGTITTTQISDNSISTAKLQANSVTASILAANSVVAGDITAGAVTAGTIAAGAVSTSELAAGAVNASKVAANTITAGQIAANTITAGQIASGTITADRLNISSLSAISANIGTITSGAISGTTITAAGSGGTITINPTVGQVTAVNGSAKAILWAWDPGTGGEAHLDLVYGITNRMILKASSLGGIANVYDSGGTSKVEISYGGILMGANTPISMGATNSYLQKASSDSWSPKLYDGGHTQEFQWDGFNLKVRIDGSTTLTVTTTP